MSIINIIDESNDDETMRIHAIELKLVLTNGRQVELQTFACGLVVPVHRIFGYGGYAGQSLVFPVTIHTNKGDINGEIGRL